MKKKQTISATIDEELIQWIGKELEEKDKFGRKKYRNRSQIVEGCIFFAKTHLEKK